MVAIFKKGKNLKKEMTLEEVTKLLNEVRLPTALVFTPTNLEEEKKKFLESDTYNPVFKYRVVENQNSEIFKKLSNVESIVDVDPRISDFYIDLIAAKIQMNQLMNAVGDNEKFTELGVKRFGLPTPILFRNACRILRGRVAGYNLASDADRKRSKVLGYDEIAAAARIVLDEFGLSEWKTEKSINIAKNGVKVGIKNKEILMDPNIEKKAIDLRSTFVHEFTHIIRAYNGKLSAFEALEKAGLPSYLAVEEGLATYNQEIMGVTSRADLKKRAARTWAVYIGQRLSFRDLYNAALAISPTKNAFDIVYRAKRGLGDTSQPGIYPKDYLYFKGFRKVRKLVAKDPTLYEKLFAGKIDLKQVKWVDEGLLSKPTLVPSKEMFERAFEKAGI